LVRKHRTKPSAQTSILAEPQVAASDLTRLVFDEISAEEDESVVSVLNSQAITQHQDDQAWKKQQTFRNTVQREFEDDLVQEVAPQVTEWLRLYWQGHTQKAIAKLMDMPTKPICCLRGKIGYPAVWVFARKEALSVG
jgi:DNA-directed RNA polymerase specialized sigma24 family protein